MKIKLETLLYFKEKYLIKEKYIIGTSILLGIIFTLLFSIISTKKYSDKMQSGLANDVLRFHILANSDSEEDQNLKVYIKDQVLIKYKEGLESSASLTDTKNYLQSNINEIEDFAQQIVYEKGYDYAVSASMSNDYFPTKYYGDITLPAGYYNDLRIEIGSSTGHNWWCVMFPPLCFVDVSSGEASKEIKEEFSKILTESEYKLVMSNTEDSKIPVKVRFKIVEWWKEKEEKNNKL